MKISQAKKVTGYSVVGHRGFPERYPENTLQGLRAAVDIGVHALELDVQATQDGELILLHDETFERTCNCAKHAHQVKLAEALTLSAHEPQRLGRQFYPQPIQTLYSVIENLLDFDGIFFIEIKSEAILYLGMQAAAEKLIEQTRLIPYKRVFISFHAEFIAYIKQSTAIPAGWVIKIYNDDAIKQAAKIQPDYLICNKTKLPKGLLPKGSWDWFVYDVVDKQEAIVLHDKGVQYIESWNPEAIV